MTTNSLSDHPLVSCRTPITLLLLTGLVYCVLLTPATGQEKQRKKIKKQLRNKKIFVEFTDRPLVDAVASIRKVTDINIIIDRESIPNPMNIPVNITLSDVTAGQLLSLLGEQYKLRTTLEKGVLIVKKADAYRNAGIWLLKEQKYKTNSAFDKTVHKKLREQINIDVTDRDLPSILTRISKKLDVNFMMGPHLRKRTNNDGESITLRKKATAKKILNTLSKKGDLVWVVRFGVLFFETPVGYKKFSNVLPGNDRVLFKQAVSAILNKKLVKSKILEYKLQSDQSKKLIRRYRENVRKMWNASGQEKPEQLINHYKTISELFGGTGANLKPLLKLEKLAKFIREHTDVSSYIQTQIKKLGHRKHKTRKKATRTLQKAGWIAAPELREHRDHDNPEIRKRVQELLNRLEN